MASATAAKIPTVNGTHGLKRISKVERYGWTISDGPGEFAWLPVGILEVDEAYQRKASENKVLAIAASWSWVACGAILVARRGDRYYVMDGDHRVLGARRRDDIDKLPCMVFETTDVKEEAAGFLRANTFRKPVTALEKFRAEIAVGDPTAIFVEELLQGSGYEVSPYFGGSSSGRLLRCVAALKMHASRDRDVLVKCWPLIVELSNGAPIHERVLSSVVYAESRVHHTSGKKASLLVAPWKERVLKLGSAGVVEASAKAMAFYSTGGPKVWATGLVEALNKGAQNRLTLDAPSPS
jgi:hypothetical protein